MKCKTALALVVATACGSADEASTPLPAEMQQISYTATDFAFSGPDTIAPGMTRIEMTNTAEQSHQLTLIKLGSGKTVDDFLARVTAPADGTPIPDWITGVGGPGEIDPGDVSSSIIDLKEGRYLAVCFVPDPADGLPHLAKGMMKEIIVNGERHQAPQPVATVELRTSDFQFISEQLAAGKNLVHVVNDGPDLHEAMLVKLDEGATLEDYMAAMKSDSNARLPGTPYGGVGALSMGQENWWQVDLVPGRYILICFIPDPEDVPHVFKGMVKEFTI